MLGLMRVCTGDVEVREPQQDLLARVAVISEDSSCDGMPPFSAGAPRVPG
jgi:hypothetical protein